MRISFLGVIVAGALLAQNTANSGPGIEFVKIQPGEFMMGCSAGDNACGQDEEPAHRVAIAKGFEIGKYEVTQAQWMAVMGSNPSTIKGDDRPVETVSKNEVQQFLDKLNARNDGYKYRLPSETEWEYAARAGSDAALPSPLGDYAWYADNSEDETHPVGQKKPNAWGLYDMFGNVREWVEGNFSRGGRGADGPPTGRGGAGLGRGGRGGRGGPGGFGRGRSLPVARGGGWDNPANFLRVSSRYHYYGPTLRVSDIGFRVVREPASGGVQL